MSAWAKPGVKCVCVVAGPLPESTRGEAPAWEPKVGSTYTVEAVLSVRGLVGLILAEQHEFDWSYSVNRFRPVTEIGSDLALFRHHLNFVGEDA